MFKVYSSLCEESSQLPGEWLINRGVYNIKSKICQRCSDNRKCPAIIGTGAFLILPLITKTLGAYSYGVWSQITISITLLSSLSLLGLFATMIRFLAAEKDP